MVHNGVDSRTRELMLPHTQSFDSSIDLEHLGKVYGCLLSYALVVRIIDVETLQSVVVPV